MNSDIESMSRTVQPYVTDPGARYPIEAAAVLAEMPRHIVLVCCRRGLVVPYIDPEYGGFYFSEDDIRTLQEIEYLRSACGVNFAGIEIVRRLMGELEYLRATNGA